MDAVFDVASQVISMAPVPYLQPLVQSFQIIWSRVGQAKSNKRQIQTIAQTVAQILLALNSQAVSNDPPGKWDQDGWMKQTRSDFEVLLSDIAAFCVKTTKKKFVKSFLDSTADQDEINSIHVRLKLSVDAFQISSQVSSQNYQKQVEVARQEDQAEINAALKQLLEKQDSLLALVGQPDAEIAPPDYNEEDTGGEGAPAGTQTTIFGLLGDIQDSVKQAGGSTERDEVLQEVLVELKKVSIEHPPPPPVDPNPVLAHMKPGIKPEVLIAPLQNHMKMYTWDTGISYCLTSQQCYQFERRADSSKLFIEYLISCDDQALQYAAVEVLKKDKAVKHFFKNETLYTPSDNPNPILAYLKPGLKISVLVLPLQNHMRDYTWKGNVTQQLTQQQVGSFFCSGPEGCQRFMDYLVETDDMALQYAALELFREDKRVNMYFLDEPEEEESE